MNNLRNIDYGQFDLLADCLLASKWIFAKTMPQHPHEYTLRKDWQFEGVLPWESAVQFIRDHSYDEYFYRKKMQRLNINDRKYWSMGAPLLDTILINRASIGRIKQPYDDIADIYDGMHSGAEAIAENKAIGDLIGYKKGSVLDIGCGTGLFKEIYQVDHYTGIDPSSAMIDKFCLKFPPDPKVLVVAAKFEEFYQPIKYDLIVSLFGAASYIDPMAIKRILNMLNKSGKFFLMFYKHKYRPITYEKAGFDIEHYAFQLGLIDCDVIDFGSYWILRN